MTIAEVQSEARFAAWVGELAADPDRRGQLTGLLREDLPLYDQRGTATIVRMRGWILVTLARSEISDAALVFVLEELDTGFDPYLVAAAARALRSYPRPAAAFAPLVLRALTNIRYRDELVSFETYGEYAVGPTGTTPVRELLATLAWLGPHARETLPELESLRMEGGGLARKYRAELDRASAAIRNGNPIDESGDSCCALPGGVQLSWPFRARSSSAALDEVVFEDQDGTPANFNELFQGHVSIVAFFYTRCDNPLKCSLTIAKLARIQQMLEARGLTAQVSTAAITYDPAYDVPERLRVYGRDRGVRMDGHHRMLRTRDGLEAVRRHFQLGVNFIESLVNRHRVEVYVLDRQGRIAASFQRLRWDEEEVVDRSVEVLQEKEEVEPAVPARPAGMMFPMLGTLAGLAMAFFPKCPICWAAYLSVFGIAGLNQVAYSPWLKAALLALVMVNVVSVWFRGRATRRMTGFYLVSLGALAMVSTMQFGWKGTAFAGVALTMAGSLLSARRAAVAPAI